MVIVCLAMKDLTTGPQGWPQPIVAGQATLAASTAMLGVVDLISVKLACQQKGLKEVRGSAESAE